MLRFRVLSLVLIVIATAANVIPADEFSQRNAVSDTPDTRALPTPEKFHLFLLVGQSNMAGRGVVEAEDQVPHPRVLMLNAAGQWVPAVAPLHFDKSAAGVGLGRTFGLEIAEQFPDITVGLIPCAVGGSPIAAWQPGEYYRPTLSHPWDDAVHRAKIAQRHGRIQGILWHQGESDSKEGLSAIYAGELETLIRRFRTDLQIPDTPFLAGQMGQFTERPWDEFKRQVDAAHRELPQHVTGTAFVSSDGLKHKGDFVHFDSASYRELGRRYADAFLSLRTGD
ncbi:MAG: sialate O-acetylesterase [Planctomycetaceae bacterium]|nr:sialate O-acetylesterase [Planctomycetaceae bacterium]